MSENNNDKIRPRMLAPAAKVVVLMLLVTAVAYPLVLTGIGQELIPLQSNGSMVSLDNGRVVGSSLIAQEFQSPKFFHARSSSESASGLDPHVTPDYALAQVENVSSATGISQNSLKTIIRLNIETNRADNLSAFAPNYVNVLELNLELTRQYPDVYAEFMEGRQQ